MKLEYIELPKVFYVNKITGCYIKNSILHFNEYLLLVYDCAPPDSHVELLISLSSMVIKE